MVLYWANFTQYFKFAKFVNSNHWSTREERKLTFGNNACLELTDGLEVQEPIFNPSQLLINI